MFSMHVSNELGSHTSYTAHKKVEVLLNLANQ